MIVITIILIILTISIYFLHSKQKGRKALVPPGPPGLPLIGNLHQFCTTSNLHVYLWQLSNKYGPLMHMKLGPVPVLIVSSAKLAREVLKTQDVTFCNRPKQLAFQKLSYNCSDIAFAPYSDYWREVKKIALVHLLSSKKIQSFRQVREDEVSRMVEKISGFANSGGIVNLSEMIESISSTLICRIAFGTRDYDQEAEIQRFHGLIQEAQAMMVSFFVSDYFPSLSWIDRASGLIDRLEMVFKKLDSFYEELIDEHLSPRRENIDGEDDILDILIHLKDDKSCSIELNWNSIKALLMNIFIAGTDTTADSIIWTMTALMKTSAVMKKLQEETRELVGPKTLVTEDDLKKLHYLKAVINEALRLYPPVPLLVPRRAVDRCTLEGYEIQPGTTVYVNTWAITRDPRNWESAHEFLPERYAEDNIDIRGHDFRMLPFGSGRRSCPGVLMGLANLELIVANLIYLFDWELPVGVQGVDTESLPGLSMRKKNPLNVMPKKYDIRST